MFLPAGSKVIALYEVQCKREVANAIACLAITQSVTRVLADRGLVVENGPDMTYCILSETSVLLSDRVFHLLIRFTTRNQLNTTELDDWVAFAWNSVAGTGRMLPSGDPNHAGRLFNACSGWNTSVESSGGVLNRLNPFSESPNYSLLCSQFQVVREFGRGNAVTNNGTIGRLVSGRVIESSNPTYIGSNPNNSTDIAGLASDAASSAARAVNDALGTEDGEGVNSNDIKFFMYASVGIIGALVAVKVLKEIKAI